MPAPTLDQRLALREKPDRPWVLLMRWSRLLFLHWEFPVDAINETLPPGLEADTHEGKAYIGVVPFRMRGVRPRFLPTVPGISNFLELNVRTYVHDARGNPGVWFYSLDADQPLAVWMARTFFHLNYEHAEMSSTHGDYEAEDESRMVDYACLRRGRAETDRAVYRYAGRGEQFLAEPGSLEFFLLERYLLFSWDARRHRLFSGRVHHAPYRVQGANIQRYSSNPINWNGLVEPSRLPDHAHFSRQVEVEAYAPRVVEAG
ncbi:MAG: DUF2071 domain-containing protein [Verrucomicrobiota bacterium]